MNPTQAEVFSLLAQLFGTTTDELKKFVDPEEVKLVFDQEAAKAGLDEEGYFAQYFNRLHPQKQVSTTQQKGKNMTQKIAGVVCLDNLTANQYRQLVSQQGVKVFHANEADAIAEAERLARANPGKTFGTLVLTSTSVVAAGITTRL